MATTGRLWANTASAKPRAWRREHAEAARRQAKTENAGRRPAPASRAGARRRASRQKRRDDRTRELAENHGQRWSSADEQYVIDHPELTNAAIAYALGRTSQAVHGRRTILRARHALRA